MAKQKRRPKPDPEGYEAPWRPNEVKGVVPPGRQLDDAPRARAWLASGVEPVIPPGAQTGPAPRTKPTEPKKKARPKKAAAPTLPLKALLDEVSEFVRAHPLGAEAMSDLGREVLQTHAPFELIVAFTVLSAMVGNNEEQRRRHSLPLERGAKAYFNLAKRLDPKVRPPRGLVPQTLDPLFYDLPATAYQLPEAFLTDAFARLAELLRGNAAHDRALLALVRDLRERFILQKRFGDEPLERMFPWKAPRWAPEDE